MIDSSTPEDKQQTASWWSDYEVQRSDGSWTTVSQLLNKQLDELESKKTQMYAVQPDSEYPQTYARFDVVPISAINEMRSKL